jgi:hypothetical protein
MRMGMAIRMERPKFPVSNRLDMYPKLKQGIATTTTRILTRILYGSKILIKMAIQMGQRKFHAQSHLMNMFHQQHQGIATMVIQV